MYTDKLTTKCHNCLHTWKQGGLMCGIWNWYNIWKKEFAKKYENTDRNTGLSIGMNTSQWLLSSHAHIQWAMDRWDPDSYSYSYFLSIPNKIKIKIRLICKQKVCAVNLLGKENLAQPIYVGRGEIYMGVQLTKYAQIRNTNWIHTGKF